MHRTPVFPAFAAALAALAAGCEWTGTSSSDSWSGSYDAMNFSGTYRSSSELKSGTESTTTTTTTDGTSATAQTTSVKETVGSYKGGTYRYSGNLSHTPVVLNSVQIQLGGITFTGDSSGNLTSTYGSGKVTTAGAWSVDVTGSTTTSGATTHKFDQNCGKIDGFSFSGKTPHQNLVPGTITVTVHDTAAGSGAVTTFTDTGKDGDGNLLPTTAGSGDRGTVNYSTGTIVLKLSSSAEGEVKASYEYNSSSASASSVLKGSGPIVAVYSYTTDPSTSPSSSSSTTTTTTTTYSTDAEAVARSSSQITAITVSQSGQNLSMSTNTGIVMSGKFTAVRETNVATTSGTATYNAQFQVSSAAGHKFVGTLNYDGATSHRTLNGTLTQGKAVYDVQGVGPAF